MRRLLAAALIVLLAASGAYLASPFITAWNIREAVKGGDATYLTDKIDWDKVKETLKSSLAAVALDLPADDAGPAAPLPTPSLWQRLKAYWGRGAVDRLVESYANAEGLPKLFSYRQTYRDAVGHVDEQKTLWNLPDRMGRAWSRVKRAEFLTPTRFAMEMADKTDPTRSFAGILEFTGLEWKLVSLHVHQSRPVGAPQSLTGSDAAETRNVLQRLRDAALGPRVARVEDPIRAGDPMER